MNRRPLLVAVVIAVVGSIVWAAIGVASSDQASLGRDRVQGDGGPPSDFVPAVARGAAGRYFVVMETPSVAQRMKSGAAGSSSAQQAAADAAAQSQEAAIAETESLGGRVVFRYDVLLNGFSAQLSQRAVDQLAARSDVASVEPVSVVREENETSIPFIGAPEVWKGFHARGQGINVAVIDTGVDYTHENFGGSGDPSDYANNDPNVIEVDPKTGEPTFPTAKVTKGYDFVGSNYDVVDESPDNDFPRPDPDPLDRDGHGSHTAGTCCGMGVPDEIGKGVAPKANVWAVKVWDKGNSTDDVLVQGYEYAMDPNGDGDVSDAADVISFSGGVDYGTLNSVEARAAQRAVDLGTVFVASAGNSGNQTVGGSAYIAGTPANARGVISVAASIDQFASLTLEVNSPQVTLPDNGLMVHQDWSPALPAGGITDDLFDGRAVDPATSDPADRMFCDPLPAASLTGRVVLVYKGSTDDGDCDGSQKVFNAQNAGAKAVVLVSLFGGLPFGLGAGGQPINIPAVMLSDRDGQALLDALSPNAPASFNDVTVNATLHDESSVVPGFGDAMTDFTSEGPARLTSALKPDISAPGFDIQSTAVGTGDKGTKLSGTSMAAPHISGVAALLRQIHPSWSPERIKAILMNQATRKMKNNDLTEPVPATVMGAGRVQADKSAKARSVARPGSLSFGLEHLTDETSTVRKFTVRNLDRKKHRYRVTGVDRYSDFDPEMTDIQVSLNGSSFDPVQRFKLDKKESQKVYVRLMLDPSLISEAEQEYGLYYFNPGMDGTIRIRQSGRGGNPKVAWHVAPLAASDNRLSKSELDLGSGQATMRLNGHGAAIDWADLYLLGDTSPVDSTGEEDLVATGARSFTGANVEDGNAQGVPTGQDALVGIGWQDFLTDADTPQEPVEIGVQTAAVHNVTETEEVDVLVDTGADGVFAGEDLGIPADYLIVKLPASGGEVCVFDLSLPNGLDECAQLYFPDYTNYNGNLFGIVVDARDLGLTNAESTFSYSVTACTGTFSGDVEGQICDTAGRINAATGTYDAEIDVADPALRIDPLVCGGFWDGGACRGADPIVVRRGSAGAGENPSILALFPNNPPAREPTIVSTSG